MRFVKDMRIQSCFVGHSIVDLASIKFRHIDPPGPNVFFMNDLDDHDGFVRIFRPLSF